jgi:cation-transporting ATPase 13A2
MSSSSFLDDVEMAHDEVFGGPMAESVPTSVSSFAHRRGRADSTASFTYYQEDEDENLPPSDDSAILDDESELHYEQDDSPDLEAGDLEEMRRTSSGYSRSSVHDHLLRRDSARTEGSNFDHSHRTSQKIYIVTEDLSIVVAGFRTSTLGFALYTTVCVLTLGLGYLLLRWLPRWQVRLVGTPSTLQECNWVVIEVRYNKFSIPSTRSQGLAYLGRRRSFGLFKCLLDGCVK